jgi:hypothetical protein
MSVTYRWDNEEKTIMRFSFEEPWTWDEYYVMKPESDKIIASVSHKVGAIIEIPRDLHLGANALTHSRTIDRTRPANLAVMIIVTESSLVKAFLGLAARLPAQFSEGFRWAPTLEKAHEIIREVLAEVPQNTEPKPVPGPESH